MLAVSIDLNVDIIAISLGVLMTCLNGATDTKILREIEYVHPVATAYLKRCVA